MPENAPSTEELLNMCDEAGSEVLASAIGDWKPSDGTYTVCIEGLRVNPWKNTKDGRMYPVFSLLMRILDGSEAGKKFENAFFGNSTGDMGAMKTLYTLVFGDDPPDLLKPLREKMVTIKDRNVEVDCTRTPSKRDPSHKFFNVKFVRVID